MLGIATPAVQSIAGETETIPVVGTAVTDYTSAKLAKSDDAPGYNVTGTSDMNPIEEQIELLQQLCPDAKTVGVLYTSSEDNSVLQASLAKQYICLLYTSRLMGRRKVFVPHAALEAVLSENICSHSLCPPRTLPPYAVRSTVGVGCAIEDAGNSQALPYK